MIYLLLSCLKNMMTVNRLAVQGFYKISTEHFFVSIVSIRQIKDLFQELGKKF